MQASDMDSEKRIVVFGDSIVSGWGVEEGQSYPSLLQKWTREQGMRYAVINAGVPGDTVMCGCLRYERDVSVHDPDTLLVAFGLNDGALRRTPYDAQRERRWRAQRGIWGKLLLLYQRGKRALLHRLGKRESVFEGEREPEPRVQPRCFSAGLSDLVRWARRDGAEVHLVSLTPVSKQRLSADQWRRYLLYDSLIRKVARRHHVLLIDLADADGEPFTPESMLAGDGVHLRAAGQEWLAGRVHAHLVSDGRRE